MTRESKLNKLIPKGYRSYCFRHRNAKRDHATSFAICVLWFLAIVVLLRW